MNSTFILIAAQIAASAPAASAPEAARGAQVTALATVEILPSGSTRDDLRERVLVRHRREADDRRITIEFE